MDECLSTDLVSNMKENEENAYPDGSFSRLFWEEQLKAATKVDARQVRWHPVMIKWCLNLKLIYIWSCIPCCEE